MAPEPSPARVVPSATQEIKTHPFFAGFSWDGLLARQLEPPYKPQQEVYAEDSEPAKPGQDLALNEDVIEEDGTIEDVADDPDPSWLDEF